MAAPRRRRRVVKTPEARRADLLTAAERLFEERGFDAVTVADIAAAAKVAKGTFYLYFASRDELLDALRAQFTDDAAGLLTGLAPPARDGDWAAFLGDLVATAIDFQVEQYNLHELVRLPHRHAEPDAADRGQDPLRQALRHVLDEGVAVGRVRIGDLAAMSDLVYDVLHLAGDRACLEPERRAAITTATTDLLARGLLTS